MNAMYCPQCGREVELDGDVRFCRYCGLALSDTKDTLHGYSEVRREAYRFINVSFLLIAILFWIQYFGLVPWNSFLGGNFLLILIFGFIFGLWFMGNWVVDKPAKYVKSKTGDGPAEPVIPASRTQRLELPDSKGEAIPAGDMEINRTAEMVERPSVTDETTRALSREGSSD
jgi:hypothetical protein